MKKSLLMLTFALISLCSFAQMQGKISGKIKDGGDKKVMIAATVSLLKAKDSSLVKIASSGTIFFIMLFLFVLIIFNYKTKISTMQ